MKKILSAAIALIFTTTVFAKIDHKKYSNAVNEIAALEKVSQNKQGALRAAIIANQLADQAKFDEMVTSIDRTFKTKKKEVVTEEYGAGAGFKILFGLLGASAHMGWDTAKLITTNPEDVAAFTEIKARDFKKLQNKLESYIKKNETELFFSKVFVAKALDLASKLSVKEAMEIYPFLMKSAQRVSGVNFVGFYSITNCLQVNYAERSKGWGVKLSGLISFHAGERTTQNDYKETTCEAEVIEVAQSDVAMNSIDLMLADELLLDMNQDLQLKIVNEAEAPVYPTWGSPYVK